MNIHRRMVAGLGIALLVVLTSCSSGGSGVQFDDPTLTANQDMIKAAAQRSALILVGTIQSVGSAPSYWSGFFASTQSVVYTVSATPAPLKGTFAGNTLTVNHLVVANSRHARSDGSIGLSPTLFGIGTQVIVIVETPTGNEAEDVSENYSTIPLSATNLTALQKLL